MIQISDLEKRFQMGEEVVTAVDGISLQVSEGDFVSIVGPSGSGKSTLMNIVGMLDQADSGQYLFDGVDVTSLGDDEQTRIRNEKIGFVFQSFHLLPRLNAEENVIAVPVNAVSQKGDKKLVTVQKDGDETTFVEVETGVENDAFVEIKSGISEGDTVVVPESEDSDNSGFGGFPGGAPEGGFPGGSGSDGNSGPPAGFDGSGGPPSAPPSGGQPGSSN